MNNKMLAVAGTVVAATLLVVMPAFAAVGSGLGLGVAASANASATVGGTSVGAGVSATVRAQLISRAQQRADQEVARRVAALNAQSVRVNAMVRLSSDEKSSLSSAIAAQITAMDALKSKVDADAAADSTSSLKADIQSITASYRIYALIIPQAAIVAASDRAMTIVATLTDLGAKLQARITAAQTAGNDTAAAAAAMADFNAKVADGQAQAQAAVNETASLQPDNGDQTVMASNTAALKDARAKIRAAQQDFVAARADAQTIIKAMASWKVSAAASSTTGATTSAQ